MKRIHDSCECFKSELDLFASLPTNTSLLSSSYTIVPLTKLNGDEPSFEIEVPGTDAYTDLSDTYLKVEIQIKKGANLLTSNDKVGPINNFAHSLFKKVELKIGYGSERKLVEIGNSHYAYKAYLLNQLNYGKDAKETWLQSGLYYKDNDFDNLSIDSTRSKKIKAEVDAQHDKEITIIEEISANDGYVKRRNKLVDSKGKIKLIIPLHCDLLHSNRLLLNNLGLYFEFERNKDSFLLMGNDKDFGVFITRASLYVRRVEINPSVKLAHISALQISNAKYPIKQNKVMALTIDDGSSEFNITTLPKIIPNKITFGLVLDEAYNGSLTTNPFRFDANGLRTITLTVNNETRVININEDENDFIEGYHSICEGLNLYGGYGNNISIDEYSGGNCLFFFNLTADKSTCEEYNLIKTGSLQITLNFKENVKKKLKLIALLEYDNEINIDKKYDIKFDYDL